jgi:hypothetical protein
MDPNARPQPGRDSSSGPEFVGELGMTAAEFRGYVAQLEAERATALQTKLGQVETYMADLEEELDLCRTLYVIAAVTEIATLRAELSGAQHG